MQFRYLFSWGISLSLRAVPGGVVSFAASLPFERTGESLLDVESANARDLSKMEGLRRYVATDGGLNVMLYCPVLSQTL